MIKTLLVIDDDPRLCATLRDALSGPQLEVHVAHTGAAGVAVCRDRVVDAVLLDQHLPDGPGASLCPAILQLDEQTKIIFMTAYPTFENAVAAVRLGAFDYLAKPFEIEALQLTVANALRLRELEAIEQLHRRDHGREADAAVLVGSSLVMRELLVVAGRAAASRASVLIAGATGTGKSLLARYVHYSGGRSSLPFVSLNCAALPESLAESELFGHERGAFTGAAAPRRGVFEMAGEGTVLLDEIGAMPVALQAKLLGVLEDRRFLRVGSEIERRVGARVIAATNTDLELAMRTGHFRQDLFYRLNVISMVVPPLCAHLEDLPELCRHLITSICGFSRPLADGEIERLQGYEWPGNVRELRNLVERASILEPTGPLAPSRLLARSPALPHDPSAASQALATLRSVERQHIEAALHRLGFNLGRTARALGISLSTLKRKVHAYGLRQAAQNGLTRSD
jgi:DNA-binding NtrC family response regulator